MSTIASHTQALIQAGSHGDDQVWVQENQYPES